MQRLTFALTLIVGILAGGLAVVLLRPAPVTLSQAEVQTIVSDMLARQPAPSQPAPDVAPGSLDAAIENYLMNDPSILERMSTKLTAIRQEQQRVAQRNALDAQHAAIYDDPGNVVIGNPKGDVTLVEMFDYNCSYCRGSLPDLATLIAEDPNLKVILKEFPILSQGSVDAAKVAALVAQDPKINYWDFHQQLFSARGEVTGQTALDVAAKLGADRVSLMLNMDTSKPQQVIQSSYDLARALNIGGTPTYILGDEMIPGAIGLDALRQRIANMRACGSTQCPPAESQSPAG